MRSDLEIVEEFARKPRVFYDRDARSWAVHSARLVQFFMSDRERAIRRAYNVARVQLTSNAIGAAVYDWRLQQFNADLARGPDQHVEAIRTQDGNIIVTKVAAGPIKTGDPVQIGGHFAISRRVRDRQ